MRGLSRMGLLAMSITALPALACSVANPPADTVAKRIAGRTDLLRLTGTFRIESVTPVPGGERSIVRGTITRGKGDAYPVTYVYAAIWVYCSVYYLPQEEAKGSFYLSRLKRDGRHELVDWSGSYIGGKAISPDPRN